MNRRTVGIANFVLSTLVIAGIIFAIFHVQDIIDFYRVQTFKPSAEISQLTTNISVNDKGKNLFFASHPELQNKEDFNQSCPDHGEETIVLGCYYLQTIYLYNVTDKRLNGVKEVTAAHEMLHAAYERLNSEDKKHLNTLLDAQIKIVTDERILNLIELYNKHEPGQLHNEMHSILGTEYRELTPALEAHYEQYFTDRKKVVSYSEGYEAIFSASKKHIEAIDAQLQDLKKQVDIKNSILETQQQQLEVESGHLDSLRNSNPEAYNRAASEYNTKVDAFNMLVVQNQQLVDQHNALVEERNREVAAQDNLYQGLNSRYQTVPQN